LTGRQHLVEICTNIRKVEGSKKSGTAACATISLGTKTRQTQFGIELERLPLKHSAS
jgi:hypothetical protein